ncbi:MAG: ATP-binding protein [Pseudomonadota bacterium]|nr:ATP-binding protein [Pseudomonadota bacterium]
MKSDIKRLAIIFIFAVMVGYTLNFIEEILLVTSIGYIIYLHKRVRRILKASNSRNIISSNYTGNQPDSLHELERNIIRFRQQDQARKKRNRKLLKEFREATKALPDSIIALDHHDRITWTNKSAITQLGIKTPDDIGLRMTNVLRDPKIKELLDEGHLTNNQVNINNPLDPKKMFELTRVKYGNNNKLIVGRDITNLEDAEIQRANFVANVSHELKSPITIFKGYIKELNQKHAEVPKKWHMPLQEMEEQANKMNILVDELLLLNKLQSDNTNRKIVSVNICSLINQAVSKAKQLNTSKTQLYVLELDNSVSIKGVEEEIYIIVSNIIFNAARYTQNEGVIKIKWSENDNGKHFQVADNGIGISEENIPRVTERFFRVDSSKGMHTDQGQFNNTGLGLALVKHSIIKYRGTLKVESSINEGSIFTITFPKQN